MREERQKGPEKPIPLVAVFVGSESDLPVMQETVKVLEEFSLSYLLIVTSAHRSPARTRQAIREAERKGVEVVIAGAGGAAHLPGVLAAETILPVVGVPVDSSPLGGLDSLLSIVQMPGGVPVATMGIGKAGARNAGLFAAQILARKYPAIAARLCAYKKRLASEIERKAKNLSRESGSPLS